MTLQVINGLGGLARAELLAAGLDVEYVDMTPGGPPPGVSAEVLFGGWGNRDTLAAHLEGVRWVQLAGTGIDGVDPVVFEADRIVTNVPGASAVAIAEFVLGAMLAFEKHFPQTWLSEPPEVWNFAELDTLAGKSLGIVGFGGIGQAIARRALAFDMVVRAVRRTSRAAELADVELVSDVAELLSVSDHLVLAVPATPRTVHLLDTAAFAAMKPGAHLVNIARGSLVDQDALRVALDDGTLAMATLDVVDPEPLPAGHWLYTHPHVRVSAHVSWASRHVFRRPVEMFLENLTRYLAGEPLQWLVDRDEGY